MIRDFTHFPELRKTDLQWMKKFEEMSHSPIFGKRITGPHLTLAPANYDPERLSSILYVGKALGGTRASPPGRTIGEVRCSIVGTLTDVKNGNCRSDFWDFALKLSEELARLGGHQGTHLDNLVWSNIFKIGEVGRKRPKNPGLAIQACQEQLAIDSLKAEIKAYRPKVVVWVHGGFGLNVFKAVVNDIDKSWHRERKDIGLYWREGHGFLPSMVWTDHPQGKGRQIWRIWIKKACQLALTDPR